MWFSALYTNPKPWWKIALRVSITDIKIIMTYSMYSSSWLISKKHPKMYQFQAQNWSFLHPDATYFCMYVGFYIELPVAYYLHTELSGRWQSNVAGTIGWGMLFYPTKLCGFSVLACVWTELTNQVCTEMQELKFAF